MDNRAACVDAEVVGAHHRGERVDGAQAFGVEPSAPVTPVTVAQSYRFVVGVDTHAATHSYAILDSSGTLLDEQTSPPTAAAGLGRARERIARRTDGELDSVLVAAEGTGSYGAVLAETLAEVGSRVVEAPTPRRERGRGKTDAMDEVTAARAILTMPVARLRDRRGGQDQVALQVLTTAREHGPPRWLDETHVQPVPLKRLWL